VQSKYPLPLGERSIVAASPLRGLRLPHRLAVAVLALLMLAVLGLWRGLSEPSLGYRFDLDVHGKVVASPTRHEGPVLKGVYALGALPLPPGVGVLPGPAGVALLPRDLPETGGLSLYYAEQALFYADHAALWQWLDGLARSETTYLHHQGGATGVVPLPKTLAELGVRFWLPWLTGLLAASVGWGIWVYRPRDGSARWYLLASTSYGFWMVVVAATGSRLLTQDAWAFHWLHRLCHLAAYGYLVGLCMVVWRYPSPLTVRGLTHGRLAWGLGLWSGVFLAINWMEWVDTISAGFRLPNLAVSGVLAALFAAQWRATRQHPVRRAQLKWFGLLLLLALTLAFVASLFATTGRISTHIRMAYGFMPMSLIFLGLVPLVTRLKLAQGLVVVFGWFAGGGSGCGAAGRLPLAGAPNGPHAGARAGGLGLFSAAPVDMAAPGGLTPGPHRRGVAPHRCAHRPGRAGAP
jgi:hypothetical protein